MKLLIVGINAKYVHTNLAIRYLYCKVKDISDCEICEYSINDNIINVEKELMIKRPDVIAFSCYIWNIEFINQICSDIKKMNKNIKIILGGPEVSYDSADVLKSCSFVDYVVKGEGEITFPQLINHLCNKDELPVKGVAYRNDNTIVDTQIADPVNFSDVPFPYADNIFDFKGKILYYESSRGCPYSCKYCLSGEKGSVRFKDVDVVKSDLSFFDSNDVSLVKFVDRTFNADRKRAIELWKYIGELKGKTRFHMEITGELLNDETIDVLKQIPPDKLQFEIGVQSTNTDTLSEIDRKCNKTQLFKFIKRLISDTDIHIHLDLIAGLPCEDLTSFKRSFNDVLSLEPDVLQLGFLKLLKGSRMRKEADKYGILYRDKAPYEIISSECMNYEEILFLKDLDVVFDKYYNSGSFVNAISYLAKKFDTYYDLFEKIVEYFRENNYINNSLSKDSLYSIFYECFKAFGEEFEMVLRKDYIVSMTPGRLPAWCNTDEEFKISQDVYEFLKDEDAKKKIMPDYYNVPAKAIIKHIRFEKFGDDIIAFDYKTGNEYNVTEYFRIKKEHIN